MGMLRNINDLHYYYKQYSRSTNGEIMYYYQTQNELINECRKNTLELLLIFKKNIIRKKKKPPSGFENTLELLLR